MKTLILIGFLALSSNAIAFTSHCSYQSYDKLEKGSIIWDRETNIVDFVTLGQTTQITEENNYRMFSLYEGEGVSIRLNYFTSMQGLKIGRMILNNKKYAIACTL